MENEYVRIAAAVIFFIWLIMESVDYFYFKKREYPKAQYYGILIFGT